MVFLFASCGLVYFCCFVYSVVVFLFFIHLPKEVNKEKDTAKTQKAKMQKKKGQENNSVSAAVFTNSVPIFGGGLKTDFLLKHNITSGFSIFAKETMGQKLSKG